MDKSYDANFLSSFLEINAEGEYLEELKTHLTNVLNEKENLENRKKSATELSRALCSCFHRFTDSDERYGVLDDNSVKEINLIGDYINKIVSAINDKNQKDEEKKMCLSELLNILEKLPQQIKIIELKDQDGNTRTEFSFNKEYSLLNDVSIKNKLEKRFKKSLNFLLESQYIRFGEDNLQDSTTVMLEELVNKNKSKLDESKKKQMESETSSLYGFLSDNFLRDYENRQKDENIKLLVDIFIYLDTDVLANSNELEKIMAEIAKLVGIFNDAVKSCVKEEKLDKKFSQDIDFFSGKMQKAVYEKNYSVAEIIWYKFRNIIKLIVTLGLSKNAKEGAKQPLLTLRKCDLKTEYDKLREQINAKVKNFKPENGKFRKLMNKITNELTKSVNDKNTKSNNEIDLD